MQSYSMKHDGNYLTAIFQQLHCFIFFSSIYSCRSTLWVEHPSNNYLTLQQIRTVVPSPDPLLFIISLEALHPDTGDSFINMLNKHLLMMSHDYTFLC